MKLLSPVAIIAVVFLLSNCSKSDDGITHINCDGIITDTLGTGDTARIYMPNAFTPNNDGLNDIIRPYTKSVTAIEFTVYDAANNVLFSTTQPGQGWPGVTTAPTGTLYYYKIQTTTAENHHLAKCGAFQNLSCKPVQTVPLFFEDQLTADGFTAPTLDTLYICP